jgi:hypothetical protein
MSEEAREAVSKTIDFLENRTDREILIYTIGAFRDMFPGNMVLVGTNPNIPTSIALIFKNEYWCEQLLKASSTLQELYYSQNELKTKEQKVDKYLDIWEATTQPEKMMSALNLIAGKLGSQVMLAHNPNQVADCLILLEDQELVKEIMEQQEQGPMI